MRTGEVVSRTLVAAAAVASLAGLSGCYTYRMRSEDDSAAGLTQKRVVHSFFWGAVEGKLPYEHCALHGRPGGNGLWQLQLSPTGPDILARTLTLGIWAPIHVAYDCSPERPEVRAAESQPAGQSPPPAVAAAPIPDTENVDERGCFIDRRWVNVSGGIYARPRELCVPKPGRGARVEERVAPLVRLVQEAERRKLPVRAVGAGWSFSQAPVGTGYLIDMRWFGGALPLPADGDRAPGTKGLTFAHFEGGTSVDAVNLALAGANEQMLTMGGSAGQTWVGALSTGTHGSAIDRQPIADHVWALHVVSEGGERVWIESKSRPLTQGGYARSIGAAFVQDDGVFNAALAGLGTFGIVYSAVVQTEPRLLYKRYRATMPLDANLRSVMKTLAFDTWAASPRPGQRPYHLEVVVDPYNLTAASPTAYVTTLWATGAGGGTDSSGAGLLPSAAVGRAVTDLANADPLDVPFFVQTFVGKLYPPIGDAEPPEPLRYVFPKSIPPFKPQSAEFDLPRASFDVALDAILATLADHQRDDGTLFYFPGVLGIRFVKGTGALLGATIYPDTVTIELAGIPGVRGLVDFYGRVDQALVNAGVPHTQHLGQANTYMECPQELIPAFRTGGAAGAPAVDRIAQFRVARAGFFKTAAGATTFANEYTDGIGITGDQTGSRRMNQTGGPSGIWCSPTTAKPSAE